MALAGRTLARAFVMAAAAAEGFFDIQWDI
jgi:hypothetical protein